MIQKKKRKTIKIKKKSRKAIRSCKSIKTGSNWFWLTLCQLVSSAGYFYKQFGTKSGRTFCLAWSGFKLFDTLMFFPEWIFQKSWFWKKNSRRPVADPGFLDVSYLHLWWLILLVEQDHMCYFVRGHYEEISVRSFWIWTSSSKDVI